MATGDGKTPGDGKSSPFGNGRGQASGGGSMAGNDFVQEPRGSAGSGGRGIDFVQTPGGSGASAGTPRDFAATTDNAKQKQGEDPAISPQTAIRDKGLLVPLADVPAGSPRAAEIGVGSIGDGKKPFRVS